MLDEVDAPLDDMNVARFAALIREMSDSVQFVVITHNKITMEMADFLMGVTMQEAGVSRLVSVDVDGGGTGYRLILHRVGKALRGVFWILKI